MKHFILFLTVLFIGLVLAENVPSMNPVQPKETNPKIATLRAEQKAAMANGNNQLAEKLKFKFRRFI